MQALPYKDRVFYFSDEDLGWVIQYQWAINKKGYVYRWIYEGKTSVGQYRSRHFMLAKEVIERQGIIIPRGYTVDHIDRNPLNNCRENLRCVTLAINSLNRRWSRVSKSGYRGVSGVGKRFGAAICCKGRTVWLGVYESAEAAAWAYNCGVRALYGNELPGLFNNIEGWEEELNWDETHL